MKIKKIYNFAAIKAGELKLENDEVVITMNGEEFTQLVTTLAIGNLDDIMYSKELYQKITDSKYETEWID